jgi:YidC/Oxa1 family membrane protein insertase
MKNPSNQTQAQQPQLPKNFSTESLKTIGVIGVLVLAIMRWNDVLSVLINILLWIYSIVGNFGVAIILFTILIKVVTWPLNAQQMKGMQAMQEMNNDKEWIAIQKKYAKDKEKLAQEQMRVYREKGINPFGSCLPMLIQLPILFALFPVLNRVLASTPLSLLQLARTPSIFPFLDISSLIPLNSSFLWMNLGRPESIPVLGFALPTLAIIVALTTFIQSKLTTPPSANPNDQSAAVAKQMTVMMPLMLGYAAINFSSGLAVYFITSNVLGIIQSALLGKVNWRNLLPGSQKK